jgi:hypothetical protein
MKAFARLEVRMLTLLASAVDGSGYSASRSGSFTLILYK